MYYLHSSDTVDYNGDGVINVSIWDHKDSGDKKATVEDVYYHLTEFYQTEGKYYDLNKNGIIEIELGEGDRNGDGKVDANDNTYTEESNHFWFVKDAEGNFSVVRGDRYGYTLKYNEETGLNERVQIEGIACRQDLEQTEQYKNAGFNIMFIDSSIGIPSVISHSADGANISYVDFDGSLYERIMDYAEELGLKCFLFGGSLHSWSSRQASLFEDYIVYDVDEDGNPTETVSKAVFENQEALNLAVADYLKNAAQHPAFYGVSLIDEPNYKMFTAIGEVVKAIVAYGDSIGKEIFIMENLLPFARDGRDSYDGVDRKDKTQYTDADRANPEIFLSYLNAYYEKAGQYMDMKYVQYDDYPLMSYENKTVLANYVQTHQITSEFAAEKGIWRSIAVQAYANTKLDGTPYGRRAVTDEDMLWQTHVSLAMGVKELSYYTLRPIHNTANGVYDNGSEYALDRLGNPTDLFASITKVNSYMNFMSAALNSFTYKGLSYYSGTSAVSDEYTFAGLMAKCGVKNDEIANISAVTLGGDLTGEGLVLISEHFDSEAGLYGYYVANASDPLDKLSGTVTFKLDTSVYTAYQLWTGTSVKNVFLPDDGIVTLELDVSEGAFIVPFKY